MVQKKSVSWTVVVLLLILFWPVGLFLLFKKVKTDKAAALKNSKVLKVVGWIFVVFGIFYALGCIGDETIGAGQALFGTLFFIGGGVFMTNASKKVRKSGEKYKKYINIVINNQQTSIENIASYMSLSSGQVTKDLQGMIDMGYFTNAFIDHGNNEIVFPHKEQMQNSQMLNNQPKQQRVVICKNCGGNNTIIIGDVCECEFCGSPISAE